MRPLKWRLAGGCQQCQRMLRRHFDCASISKRFRILGWSARMDFKDYMPKCLWKKPPPIVKSALLQPSLPGSPSFLHWEEKVKRQMQKMEITCDQVATTCCSTAAREDKSKLNNSKNVDSSSNSTNSEAAKKKRKKNQKRKKKEKNKKKQHPKKKKVVSTESASGTSARKKRKNEDNAMRLEHSALDAEAWNEQVQ